MISDATLMAQCPQCGDSVPLGGYCGACGAQLSLNPQSAGVGYRAHAYAAAAGEHLFRVSIVSSLFPHLPHRSRTPFRTALILLASLLIVLSLLRMQAAMVAVSALGFPLLFQLYLQESDVYDDLPRVGLAISAALGALLGWGWALLTARHVVDVLSTRLISGVTARGLFTVGVLIPVGGMILMVVPALVLRLTRRGNNAEALDGFLFGAIGALGFTVAGTLTHLEPQLRTGLVAHGRPIASLLVEALLQGGAVPLTGAGVGGVVGATLWVTRRRVAVHRGRLLTSPVIATAAGAVLYAALGLVDLWQPPDAALLALHGLGAAVALLVLRLGIHAVLLHEEHDIAIGALHVCPHCEQVVAAMPFCSHCGTASRASSRSRRVAMGVREHANAAEGGDT